jgi:muramoyltetrapeptide carboxypeptidase LdcA involved in peptidoglycan recycling
MRKVWLMIMLLNFLLLSNSLSAGEIRTVFVTAPSSFPDRGKLDAGVAALRNAGFRVVVGRSCQVSLSPREKAQELNEAFSNPEYEAIITARGGYGSYNILDWLDWETIAANPKPLVGYSDITALLLAIYFKTGMSPITGRWSPWNLEAKPVVEEYNGPLQRQQDHQVQLRLHARDTRIDDGKIDSGKPFALPGAPGHRVSGLLEGRDSGA